MKLYYLALTGWLLFGYLAILSSHFHYTVDVMVGVLFSVLAFFSYHQLMKMVWMRKNRSNGLVAGMRWFEKYSVDLKLWRLKAHDALSELITGTGELEELDSSDDDSDIEEPHGQRTVW